MNLTLHYDVPLGRSTPTVRETIRTTSKEYGFELLGSTMVATAPADDPQGKTWERFLLAYKQDTDGIRQMMQDAMCLGHNLTEAVSLAV